MGHGVLRKVLISFREWLHSYKDSTPKHGCCREGFSSLSESGFIPTNMYKEELDFLVKFVLISFREWLHSYRSMINKAASKVAEVFSSLSESGFIPTLSVAKNPDGTTTIRSHLFQRVASFLQFLSKFLIILNGIKFSSLSESGFIPTLEPA